MGFTLRLPSLLTAVRVASLCVFVLTTFSVTVSLTSLTALLVVLVSVLGFGRSDTSPSEEKGLDKLFDSNPLKGKPRLTSLSEDREREVMCQVGHFVASHHAQDCPVLDQFQPIQCNSDCIFARRAKLWGSKDWDSGLSLEENVFRSSPVFLKFTLVCQELGLDGFLYLLPGHQYGHNPQVLGQGVRRLLQTLSDLDPQGVHCMDKSYVAKRGWVFEFNQVTFFLTTFAPCYPPSSSRYAHGAHQCFLLLQPELSFAQHDLPDDDPDTRWEQPRTVRERIRVAFRGAGRQYLMRPTLSFPMAWDIVKPLNDGDQVVQWWLKDADL